MYIEPSPNIVNLVSYSNNGEFLISVRLSCEIKYFGKTLSLTLS